MGKDLEKDIILRKHRIIYRTDINPLELRLVVGGEYKINEEDNKREKLHSSLLYSFEQ